MMEIGQKVYIVKQNYKGEEIIEEYEIQKIGRKYFYVWQNNAEYTILKYEINPYDFYTYKGDYYSKDNLYLTMQDIQNKKDSIDLYRKIKNALSNYTPSVSLDKLKKINEILEEKLTIKYPLNMEQFLEKGSKALAGSDEGKNGRKLYNLDIIEDQFDIIEVIFPDDLFSLNTSFFLGFFSKSIKKFGEDFLKKFQFKGPEIIFGTIQEGIKRVKNNKEV